MTRLRLAALSSALIAATVSVILTVRAGLHSHSVLLVVLMAIWVLAPFVALLLAIQNSQRWREFSRKALYLLTLFVAWGAFCAYIIYAINPPRVKAAAPFVAVPLVSWVLCAILPVAIRLTRGRFTV